MADTIAQDILIYTGTVWESVKDGTVSIYDGAKFRYFLQDDIKIYADGNWCGVARSVSNIDLSDIKFTLYTQEVARNWKDMSPPGTLSIVSKPSSIIINQHAGVFYFNLDGMSPPGTKGTVVFKHSLGFTFEIHFEYI